MVSPVTLAGRLIQRAVIPMQGNQTDDLAACQWDDNLPAKFLEAWTNWKNRCCPSATYPFQEVTVRLASGLSKHVTFTYSQTRHKAQ
jgi:hypothetical protein